MLYSSWVRFIPRYYKFTKDNGRRLEVVLSCKCHKFLGFIHKTSVTHNVETRRMFVNGKIVKICNNSNNLIGVSVLHFVCNLSSKGRNLTTKGHSF